MNIGFIVGKYYSNDVLIMQFISKIKAQEGPFATIHTTGITDGDLTVKKYAIQSGFSYKEYNLASTPYNLYSAYSRDFYGRKHHPTQYLHSYTSLARTCDLIAVFTNQFDSDNWKQLVKDVVKKSGKKYFVFK